MKLPFIVILSTFLYTSAFCLATSDPEIPKSIQKDTYKLAKYLTKNANTEKEMVASIYEWITSNIAYDVKQTERARLNKNQEVEKVLKKKKAICYGYAELFKSLCTAVGVNCEIVPGYVRDENFIKGKYMHIDYHCWNAYEADGEWYLCDPTWDSGHMGMDAAKITKWFYKTFRKKKKDKYPKNKYMFIQSPTKDHYMVPKDTFLLRHLPAHPMWQLRDQVLPMFVFENEVDTIRKYLYNDEYYTQDFQRAVEGYQDMDDDDKPIFLGETGFAFNPRNTTIKTAEYTKYLTLLNDKELQQQIKNSSVARKDLAIFLNEKNDTVKKYLKLSVKMEKTAFKHNNKLEKIYFKELSGQHKILAKSLKTTDKNVNKAVSKIEKSNNTFNGLLKKHKKFNYQYDMELSSSYHNIKDEDHITKLEALRNRREELSQVLKKEFSNNNLKELYQSISYALEYTKHNLSIIEVNNHLIDDVLNIVYFKQDSLIDNANDLVINSILNETFSKSYIDSCKALIRAYKSLSRDFKSENNKKYNRLTVELEKEINDITRMMLNYSLNGKKYNRVYLQRLSQIENVLGSIKRTQEKQTKAEEKRKKEIDKNEELRNKKANKLFDKIEDLLNSSEKFVKKNKRLLS